MALGGLGEANFGQYKDEKIIAYIAIGTGVGGVRIVDSQIDRNSQGFEPGHQIIVIGGKDCHCGGKGHFEAYVGGYYLERDFHKKGEDIRKRVRESKKTNKYCLRIESIVNWY